MAVDAVGLPVRALVTKGTTADCKCAAELIEGFEAEALIADRGYDSNAIVEMANQMGMEVVIPPRKNRKVLREYDHDLYRKRHLVENAFLVMKRWRGISTRYAKNEKSFLAAIHIRCMAIWLGVS